MDNPDEIWAVLSNDEKQQFKALIKSGEASKLLPPWIPWWVTYKKPLIESLETTEETKQNNKQEEKYPAIIDVQPFNQQKVILQRICISLDIVFLFL